MEPKLTRRFSNKFTSKIFTVSIDGSDTSEFAFDLVQKNFLTTADSLYATYIFNLKKDSKFNYKNKKEIVEAKYYEKIDLLKYTNNNIYFLQEDRSTTNHPLEQVYAFAIKKQSNFFVCGFTGMKGPRGDNEELTKGVEYLLKNCQIPFILIKDKTIRQERKDGKYLWLCIFDNQLTNAHSAFEAFMPLIETEKDEVITLSMQKFEGEKDFAEDIFKEKCKEHNILNYSYERFLVGKDETIASMVNKRINFGENQVDFVVLLNNKTMFSQELAKNNDFNIILKSKCNICVLNQ